ncbi:hypothetical protein A8990_11673 [Paenibacillus taihuensis]|uniref:Tetratricopeptide repeat protein n=1 Tax=Paenibacillus taihuensis TaxID=1156355 RepID=A0A3D9S1Y8_9BACL|nr:hypothetical protein [Paenibacillus taihuensis]REE83894.1 hypothetical protein A8990_11673 [Paenibacillus taihuensis]
MNKWLRWASLLPLGFAIGLWIGTHDQMTTQDWLLVAGVLVLTFALFFIPSLQAVFWTPDIDKVEAFLKRTRAKYLQNGIILDAANGDFEAVERAIPRIRNKRIRAAALISLHLERREIQEALRLLDDVQSVSHRNYVQAIIAIMQNDFDRADAFKDGIRSKVLQLAIDAEIAFKKGEQAKADQIGQQVLAQARGVLKFSFTRSLERQQRSPQRSMYF